MPAAPPLLSSLQRAIYSAMLAYVREPRRLIDPPLTEVIQVGAERTRSTIGEAEATWDRVMPYGEELWVTSTGRVAQRGHEPRPLPTLM